MFSAVSIPEQGWRQRLRFSNRCIAGNRLNCWKTSPKCSLFFSYLPLRFAFFCRRRRKIVFPLTRISVSPSANSRKNSTHLKKRCLSAARQRNRLLLRNFQERSRRLSKPRFFRNSFSDFNFKYRHLFSPLFGNTQVSFRFCRKSASECR